MIADLEGPSFISRTVAHRRLDRRMLVTQDPIRKWSDPICYNAQQHPLRCGRVSSSGLGNADEATGIHPAYIGGAAAWPLAARAQQSNQTRRIGVLMGFAESDPEAQSDIAAFRQTSLQKLGLDGGGNVRIAYRWVAGDAARMRHSRASWWHSNPTPFLPRLLPAVAALLRETRTIPIVFVQVADPVRAGFVDSLASPERERHWVQRYTALVGWKVGSTAQGDRAQSRASYRHVQPGDGPRWRIGFFACDRS